MTLEVPKAFLVLVLKLGLPSQAVLTTSLDMYILLSITPDSFHSI